MTKTDSLPKKVKRSNSSKRDHILDTLERLYSQKDFILSQLTLEKLAKEAKTSRMTLYRHFASKEDLFQSAHKERGLELSLAQLGTREKILQAAKKVFVSEGFDATMESIAQAANLGVATLYRQFGDKEKLKDEFRQWLRPSAAFEELALSESEDIKSDLTALVASIITRLQENKDIMILTLRERLRGKEWPRSSDSGVTLRRLIAYFEKQSEAGRLENIPAKDLALSLIGMILAHAWIAPAISKTPPRPIEQIAQTITQIFLQGSLVEFSKPPVKASKKPKKPKKVPKQKRSK